ncbi:TadE-like protein (plasmid) [Streptomyces sp. YIM 121038]|nr:TadE-like protein [Streptomyces sp. YIM 121038]
MPRWWRRRVRAACGRSGDAGISTLEFLLIAPALLIISLIVLQLGVFFLASTAAHTAARKGAQAGAAYQARPGEGAARAKQWLSAVDVVRGARVSTAGSSGGRVRVTVTGHVMSFLPWDLRIQRSAEDTVEVNR